MDTPYFVSLAREILEGRAPTEQTRQDLAAAPECAVFSLMAGADMIRRHYFGNRVGLCTICNGKSGKCSEDCAYCSQSSFAQCDIPVYPLMDGQAMAQGAAYAARQGIHRYSIVTSGKRLPRPEVEKVAQAIAGIPAGPVRYCASLGILEAADFEILRSAGVTRYHHNLESARSHFGALCTTHTYEQRVACIRAAKEAGLSVCSGGIFGTGETDGQVVELALALRDLDVDAVPVNFLIPIPGARLEKAPPLSPLRCLKIIALLRFILPEKEIIVCGGREAKLKRLHPLVFHAGASGVMTGDYLTAKGRDPGEDFALLDQLGLEPQGQRDRRNPGP